MPQRPFQEFVKVYPKPFVVSRDRLSVQEAQECTPEKRDALVASVESSLLRDLTLTPRVPRGRNTLSDFIEASAATTFGIERAVVLYLACQWALKSGGEQVEEKAKALGFGSGKRGLDLSRATLEQSLKILGVNEGIKLDDPDAFSNTLKALEEKCGVNASLQHEFYNVANHYARTALVEGLPNWSVLQNWMSGRMQSANEKDAFKPTEAKPFPDLSDMIAKGAKINASRIADELIEQATPLNKHDASAITNKALTTAQKWMMGSPQAFFPHYVNQVGYDIHIAAGNSLYHDNFVNSVFKGHNWSETFRGFKVDSIGLCSAPFKKIMISTGKITTDENSFGFNEDAYKRTIMEEMFHAAEGATIIKIGNNEVNPRHLIDRMKLKHLTEALPARADQLEEIIKKSGMEGKLGQLEKRIDTYLTVEGTHNAEKLSKMSFKEKMIALSDGIINLHTGYESGWFTSRNAETLVRMHCAYHTAFSDPETGMNATPLLGIMMPELYGLYTKVVMPAMLKNEAKAIATGTWDKVKMWVADKVHAVKSWFTGGPQKIAGMTTEQIVANKEEEQREVQLAKESERKMLSIGSHNIAADPVFASISAKSTAQNLLAQEAGSAVVPAQVKSLAGAAASTSDLTVPTV